MKVNLIALCLGLGAGVALAQGRFDANGDGVVSLEEFQAARAREAAERFAALDTDGDGLLSPQELDAARGELVARIRERAENIDTDGDGAWSFAELQAVRPNLDVSQFNRMDRNGDGLIGEDERPPAGRRFRHPPPL